MTHRCAAWRHQHRDEPCDGCRALYNRRAVERKQRRYAEREEIDGRLVAVRAGLPHGDANTYNNWGCRCVPCAAAKNVERALYPPQATSGLPGAYPGALTFGRRDIRPADQGSWSR